MGKFVRPDTKPLLVILVKRTILFFFGICILLSFLYAIGTRQGFIDATQIQLLRWAVVAGLFLWVACAYGIFLDLWLVLYRKMEYAKSLAYYIVFGLFGSSAAVLGTFILALTEGRKA